MSVSLLPENNENAFGRREQAHIETDRYAQEVTWLTRLRRGDRALAIQLGGSLTLMLTVGIFGLIQISSLIMPPPKAPPPAPVIKDSIQVYLRFIDAVDAAVPKSGSMFSDAKNLIVGNVKPDAIVAAYAQYLRERSQMSPSDVDSEYEEKVHRRIDAMRSVGLLDQKASVRFLLRQSADNPSLLMPYAEAFYGHTPPGAVYAREPSVFLSDGQVKIYMPPLSPAHAHTPRNALERKTLRANLHFNGVSALFSGALGEPEKRFATAAAAYLQARMDDRAALDDPDPETAKAKFAASWRTGDDLVLISVLRRLVTAGKLRFYPLEDADFLLRFE